MRPSPDALATLQVELCGKLADGMGHSIPLDIPALGCSASEVLESVSRQHPSLARHMAGGRVKLCVNEAIVGPGAQVTPQDNVALFPPVSGG